MAPWLIAAALALQKKQEQEAKQDARAQERSSISADRAGAMGYPVYGMQAQAANNQIDDIEGPNYLGSLLDAEEQKRKGGDKNAQLGGNDYMRLFMK